MKKLINQIIKFGIVGFIAFLIDYGLFALLTLVGLHYSISQIISFIVSFIFNYTASMKWVFDSNSKNKFIPFLLLSLIGLGINELLLYIGIDLLHYNKLIVKLISTIIVMIFNFTTRKILIEKKTN